jgi:DNA modification methylase
MARYLEPGWRVLDPFGGVGGLAKLAYSGARIFIGEIEYPIICQAGGTRRVNANALYLPYANEAFDMVATSPTYGNRMADQALAWNPSRYNTYDRAFGFPLHLHNTGGMNFGPTYCATHLAAWHECHRVLKPGGILLLNISDHYRKGIVVKVSDWHREALVSLGLVLSAKHEVRTPRLRYGKNSNLRCDYEYIYVFRKGIH